MVKMLKKFVPFSFISGWSGKYLPLLLPHIFSIACEIAIGRLVCRAIHFDHEILMWVLDII